MKSLRGVAALEFLIVVPVLIVFLFGMVSIALAISSKDGLQMMARAGMQHAASGLAASEDLAAVTVAAEAAGADLNLLTAVLASERCGCLEIASETFTPVGCTAGYCPAPETRPQRFVNVTVSAEYPFPWNVPGLSGVWQLSATAETRTR